MPPLADTHVHLLAGLDDGPATEDVAVAMCRKLVSQGVSIATALAHQNAEYPANTPERLLEAARSLKTTLAAKKIPLTVVPTSEVMLSPTLIADWDAGRLLSVGNHRQWLLVEMPHEDFIDVLPLTDELRSRGLRLIIAHAERYPELLFDQARVAEWVAAGCLIQLTARTIAEPWFDEMGRRIEALLQGGYVHLLGSDGHGIDRRQPLMEAGFQKLVKLIGRSAARRIGSTWGNAILRGERVDIPPPQPIRRNWFSRWF